MNIQRLFLGILLLITGCELLERPLSVQPAEERMSLASLRVGNDAVVLSITRSFSALSAKSMSDLQENAIEALFVNQARVEFQSGNEPVIGQKLNDVPGLYLIDIADLVLQDSAYISVYDSLSQETVFARAEIMNPVHIDSISYMEGRFVTDTDTLRLHITDPDSTQHNYFLMQVFDAAEFASSMNNLDSLFFESAPRLTAERTFSDLTLSSQSIITRTAIPQTISPDTMIIAVAHIEEAYFRYLDARKRNAEGAGGIFNEPIQFPGNVTGGYGFVSLHVMQYQVFIKPD